MGGDGAQGSFSSLTIPGHSFAKKRGSMVRVGILASLPQHSHWSMTSFDFLNCFMFVYLDDILIYFANLQEHLCHVRMVFQHLLENKLCVKRIPCDVSSKSGFHYWKGSVEDRSQRGQPSVWWLLSPGKLSWWCGTLEADSPTPLCSSNCMPPGHTVGTHVTLLLSSRRQADYWPAMKDLMVKVTVGGHLSICPCQLNLCS